MNNIIKISNPMLIGAIALIKKKKTPENVKMFVDELLHAKLLAPATITPPPEVDENGNRTLAKDSKVSFLPIPSKDGKAYFTIFTDLGEMRQLKSDIYMTVLPIDFKSMAALVNTLDERCNGIVLNPYGENVVLNRKFIESIIGPAQKEEKTEE